MTPEQFESYELRLSLPDRGLAYLEEARNGKDGQPAAPSRNVQHNGESLLVRYASVKNQKVLPLESRRVELAIALLLENDDDVVEFLSQPPPIEIEYKGKDGDVRPVTITPDFVVMRRGRVELVEGKPASHMDRLVQKKPGRFSVAGKERWSSPPAEEVARELGFNYRLWTDAEFTREHIRNLKHLDPFLKLGPNHFALEKWKLVQEFVLAHPGITLEELVLASGVDGACVARWMLAHRLIFCDLDKFILAEPENARVYPSSIISKAMEAARIPEPRWPSVQNGAEVSKTTKVLSVFTKALLERGPDEFAQAHRRWLVITGQVPRDQWDATARSVRNWRRAYKAHGYLGLLSDRHKQGNRTPRLNKNIRNLAQTVIETHHLRPPKKSIFSGYLIFRAKCIKENKTIPDFKPPSHVWYYNQVRKIKKEKIVKSQEGNRAAYPYHYNPKSLEGLWDAHGDYPFMDVHCDHTELSIFLKSSSTGQTLGKPWLTVLFDATCHMVLAIYISFDSPASDTLMMVLRDCVQRWGRLPFGMVVDNGSDFGSTYFETLTGSRGIMVTKRPKDHPKFGNPIENFFGITEAQFIQMLQGSSLIFKTPRKSTKSVDPRGLSLWTIRELFDAFEYNCFKLFNQTEHKDLGMTPAKAFEELLERHGIKDMPHIDFDFDFLIQTMPEIQDKTACVQKPCTVKVRGDHYHNTLLSGYLGKDLPVRWDPMDPSRVLVQTREGWVECKSKFLKQVAGLSSRDVKFFAQELRARHAATMRNRADIHTAKGEFLIDLKENKETEIQIRLDKAAENFELNKKHGQPCPSAPSHKSNPKPRLPSVKPPALPKRKSISERPATRIKAPNYL